jgi:hypothetical protein
MIELLMLCTVLLVAVFLTKQCLTIMLWFLGRNNK